MVNTHNAWVTEMCTCLHPFSMWKRWLEPRNTSTQTDELPKTNPTHTRQKKKTGRTRTYSFWRYLLLSLTQLCLDIVFFSNNIFVRCPFPVDVTIPNTRTTNICMLNKICVRRCGDDKEKKHMDHDDNQIFAKWPLVKKSKKCKRNHWILTIMMLFWWQKKTRMLQQTRAPSAIPLVSENTQRGPSSSSSSISPTRNISSKIVSRISISVTIDINMCIGEKLWLSSSVLQQYLCQYWSGCSQSWKRMLMTQRRADNSCEEADLSCAKQIHSQKTCQYRVWARSTRVTNAYFVKSVRAMCGLLIFSTNSTEMTKYNMCASSSLSWRAVTNQLPSDTQWRKSGPACTNRGKHASWVLHRSHTKKHEKKKLFAKWRATSMNHLTLFCGRLNNHRSDSLVLHSHCNCRTLRSLLPHRPLGLARRLNINQAL